jgi:hypothetical protein
MDCFASLAMTRMEFGLDFQTAEETCIRILAAPTARALRPSHPSRLREGAGKAGCRLHPWAPCNKKHGGRTTGQPDNPGLPCAMVLTVSFVLSPVTGLSCHRRPQIISASLAPASGRQDHTTSPSALAGVRRSPTTASTASRRAFVTIAIRPSCRAGRRLYRGDLGANRSGLFLAPRLDGANHIDRIEQIHPAAQRDGNLSPPRALKLHVGNIYPT